MAPLRDSVRELYLNMTLGSSQSTRLHVLYSVDPTAPEYRDCDTTQADRWIQQAFAWIAQTQMGKSLIRVCSRKSIKILFNNSGSYRPDLSNERQGVIKWGPLAVLWVMDFAKSTAKRGRKGIRNAKSFDHELIVRPASDDWQFITPAPYAIEAQSAPLVLLHELGHMAQHAVKGHYFTEQFKQVALGKHKQRIQDGVNIHDIDDIECPWEVDNINWHEVPTIGELRKKGIFEGVRWHYADGLSFSMAQDFKVLPCGEHALLPVYKFNDVWHHIQQPFSYDVTKRTIRKLIPNLSRKIWEDHCSSAKQMDCMTLMPSDSILESVWSDFFQPRRGDK